MAGIVEVLKISFLAVGWWAIPLILIFFYRKKLKKHPIECIIYEKRGENIIFSRDMCGRFEEPVTCYRLKINKDTIPIPQYDWVLQNLSQPTNLFEKMFNLLVGKVGTITLFKYGSKQYKPVRVKLGDNIIRKFKEVKDKDGQPIWVYTYELVNPKKSMNKLAFEVIDWDDINHMTQELRAIATRRSPIKEFWEKWGVPIALGVVAVIIIITVYLGYKFMGEAGDKYIQASKDVSGFSPPPQATTETTKSTASPNPLGLPFL